MIAGSSNVRFGVQILSIRGSVHLRIDLRVFLLSKYHSQVEFGLLINTIDYIDHKSVASETKAPDNLLRHQALLR